MKKIKEEISYRIWLITDWIRLKYLKIFKGYKMDFYCQSEIEFGVWCKTQCDHCKEYYKPLEDEKKDKRIIK